MTIEFFILFFFKHAWILFVANSYFNDRAIRKKAGIFLEANPDKEIAYKRFRQRNLILENIPWFIMAFGDLTGMTKSIFDFFSPGMLNPIVLLFHLSLIVLWIITIYWVYFSNGADFLADYPNRFNSGSPKGNKIYIKIAFALMLLCAIAAEIFMWTSNGLAIDFH